MNCDKKHPICSLTYAELLHKIRIEDDRYRQNSKSDPRYLFELWCRIFCYQQDDGLTYFEAYYRGKSLSWVARYQLTGEDFDEVYNDALLKLTQKMTPEMFQGFSSPWKLNRYFYRVVWSTTMDFLRGQKIRQWESPFSDEQSKEGDNGVSDILKKEPDPKPLPSRINERDELITALWASVDRHIKNEVERFIMVEYYVYDNRKPSQIACMLEQTHHVCLTASQVSRKRQGVVLRIGKNPGADLLDFF
ncbi:MAG: hypothetical protein ACPG8W_11690 [Candidatus Promineifilaceae bacterium]